MANSIGSAPSIRIIQPVASPLKGARSSREGSAPIEYTQVSHTPRPHDHEATNIDTDDNPLNLMFTYYFRDIAHGYTILTLHRPRPLPHLVSGGKFIIETDPDSEDEYLVHEVKPKIKISNPQLIQQSFVVSIIKVGCDAVL
ncbi:hypothetical protein BLAT2472_60052 [Burkholderia latens]